MGLAVFNHGKVVYMKAYGVRDKEKNLPLTGDSVMSAASFSKVAFADMVMQLVEQGTLDLDKPIYKYLPKPLPNIRIIRTWPVTRGINESRRECY